MLPSDFTGIECPHLTDKKTCELIDKTVGRPVSNHSQACQYCIEKYPDPKDRIRSEVVVHGIIRGKKENEMMQRQPESCPHARNMPDDKIECGLVSELAGTGYLWEKKDCLECCREPLPTITKLQPKMASMLGQTIETLTLAGRQALQEFILPKKKLDRPRPCKHLGAYVRPNEDELKRHCSACAYYECEAKDGDEVRRDADCETCELYVAMPQQPHEMEISPPVGVAQDVVKYDAEAHGFGDLLTVLWVAEGAKQIGRKVIFFAMREKADLIKMFGFETTDDRTGAVNTFKAYGEVELKQERGNNGRMNSRAKALGLPEGTYKRPTWSIPAESKRWADMVLKNVVRPLVMIFPQVEWKPREWPRAYFMDLAYDLEKMGWHTIMMAKNDDVTVRGSPRYFWGQPWANVMALMERATMVVANDSGPAWLGGTMNVRTLVVTGPTNPAVFREMPSVECVQSGLDCVGCHFGGPYRRACDVGCTSLMLTIPDVVIERIHNAS